MNPVASRPTNRVKGRLGRAFAIVGVIAARYRHLGADGDRAHVATRWQT
jgi:hypothetical protein